MAHPQGAFECRAGIGEMRVEVLYFEGCPTYQTTETLLREILVGEDIQAEVYLVRVDTKEEAERLRFAGSPSIRLNGEEMFPVPERDAWALGCRTYQTPEGLKGWPTREMIREALAARNLLPSVS
jgi:hypothetical protein